MYRNKHTLTISFLLCLFKECLNPQLPTVMSLGGHHLTTVKNNSKEGYSKYPCILLAKICHGSIYTYG